MESVGNRLSLRGPNIPKGADPDTRQRLWEEWKYDPRNNRNVTAYVETDVALWVHLRRESQYVDSMVESFASSQMVP